MSKRAIIFNLHELTDGERLWAHRRWNMLKTQYAMAEWYEISHRQYVDLELGRRMVPRVLLGAGTSIRWEGWPLLALARRRSGLGLAQVAKRLGLSRQGYLNRERVGDIRLVNYWRGQGFKF